MPVIHHVGYWVDDLGAAQAQWSQHLGVGPFQVIEHVPFDSFVLTAGGQEHNDVIAGMHGRLAALSCLPPAPSQGTTITAQPPLR